MYTYMSVKVYIYVCMYTVRFQLHDSHGAYWNVLRAILLYCPALLIKLLLKSD